MAASVNRIVTAKELVVHSSPTPARHTSFAMYVAFVIIVVSFVAALLTEGASWYLIYRKEDYQRLKKTIETLQSKGQSSQLHSTGTAMDAHVTTAPSIQLLHVPSQ